MFNNINIENTFFRISVPVLLEIKYFLKKIVARTNGPDRG